MHITLRDYTLARHETELILRALETGVRTRPGGPNNYDVNRYDLDLTDDMRLFVSSCCENPYGVAYDNNDRAEVTDARLKARFLKRFFNMPV